MIRKILIANPIGWFIYTTLGKFKILALIAIVVVTFWVLKGFGKAGILQGATQTITQGFSEIKAVAQHCSPKIADLEETWECIKNVPEYQPMKQEKGLESTLMEIYKQDHMVSPFDSGEDPYQ